MFIANSRDLVQIVLCIGSLGSLCNAGVSCGKPFSSEEAMSDLTPERKAEQEDGGGEREEESVRKEEDQGDVGSTVEGEGEAGSGGGPEGKEIRKSYDKMATLKKEFGQSGSYRSQDGTLYIGKVLVESLYSHFLGDFDSRGVRTGLGHLEVRMAHC